MITEGNVQAVSDHAVKLSNGVFGLQASGNIGYGMRYIDRCRDKVWAGRRAGARAASYYLGVIDAFNPGAIADLPGTVNAVRADLISGGWRRGGWDQAEYDTGGSDACRYCERQAGAS